MKRIITFILTMMLFGLWAPAFAGVVQRTENFDSLPGFVGSGNTTSPQLFGYSSYLSNNFGYSLSNNAGGAASGEMGGANERSPKAWYADGSLGTIDLSTDNLSVTFNFMIDQPGNSGLGYFNETTYAGAGDIRAGIIFGFRFDDLSFYALAGGGSVGGGSLGQLTPGVPATMVMTYTAATQLCSWTVDGGTPFTEAVDLSGLVVDHLGMMTHGDSSGHGNNLWFDDLEYTVGADAVVAPPPGPTPVPTPLSNPVGESWVETFNRTSEAEMYNTKWPNTESLVKMSSGPTMSELGWGGFYPPSLQIERRTRLDNGPGTNWIFGDDDSHLLSITDDFQSAGAYAYTMLRIPIDLTVNSPKIEFDADRNGPIETNLKMILKTATDGWIISEDVTRSVDNFQQTLGGDPTYVINLPGDITAWFPITNATDAPKPDLDGDDNGFTNDPAALVIGGTPVASPDLSEVSAFGIYVNSPFHNSNGIAIDGIRLTGDILTPNEAKTWMLIE
jgi:hypothetical protein